MRTWLVTLLLQVSVSCTSNGTCVGPLPPSPVERVRSLAAPPQQNIFCDLHFHHIVSHESEGSKGCFISFPSSDSLTLGTAVTKMS